MYNPAMILLSTLLVNDSKYLNQLYKRRYPVHDKLFVNYSIGRDAVHFKDAYNYFAAHENLSVENTRKLLRVFYFIKRLWVF